MPSVIFICTANICRSPMAAAIFRNIVDEVEKGDEWRVESAGVWGMDGSPAASGSQNAVRKWGLDLRGHRARSVSRELLENFDLILTMEQGHKEALKWQFPELGERIFMMSEIVGVNYDIKDPIGGSLEDFIHTADELNRLLRAGLAQIKLMALRLE